MLAKPDRYQQALAEHWEHTNSEWPEWRLSFSSADASAQKYLVKEAKIGHQLDKLPALALDGVDRKHRRGRGTEQQEFIPGPTMFAQASMGPRMEWESLAIASRELRKAVHHPHARSTLEAMLAELLRA